MPTFYNFRENGVDYSFDDIFVPADLFRDGNLWTWGNGDSGRLGNASFSLTNSTPSTTFAGGNNWKQINAGSFHTVAIKTDGTLWTWGRAARGRLGTNFSSPDISTPSTTFAGGNDWKQVSGGSEHTVAIKTDGTLWTWGEPSFGATARIQVFLTPVTTFAGGTNWADTATTNPEDLYTLSCGVRYTAAIKTDGTLWTWGRGSNGQLGDATIISVSTPVTTFSGGTNWKQVSSGNDHTAAIKTDGTLWTWGNGVSGRLGNAQLTDRSTPVTTFSGGTNWKQVTAGTAHTAAIKTDGTLWVWGLGSSGQLGTGTLFNRSTPVTTFAGGTNWKQVSAGGNHTAAIKTDGTLWTWGRGSNGQLGDATIISVSTPVTTFSGGTNWKQVSSGNDHTAAIKTDGTLWTWGAGGNGRLGNANITDRSTPVTTFAGGTNWKQVGSGSFHTAAVKTDGTLWTWGFKVPLGVNNIFGTNSTPVTTFAGGTNWKQVGGGSLHTAALSGNELFLFGESLYGEIGNAYITTDNTIPLQPFESGTNWKQVSAGGNHTAAIKTDGTLWTWGRGSNGQLGNADVTDRFTPITTFAGGTNWKQVSTIGEHTAAIKTDGTLWTWGRGSNGQLGNAQTTDRSTPVTTFTGGTNWKQVSAGNFHTSAIKTDGTLWGWGSGNDGVLGTNNTFTRSTPVTTFAGGNNWKQVGAGNQYTTAIKTDGTLWTWGYGTYGRLGTNSTVRSLTPVTTFAGGTNWKQVDAGQHTAAIIYDDPVL